VTAFIGDSISYGYLVAQDEAFPSKVQQIIRKRYGGAYTNFTPADCGNSASPSDSGRGTSQSGTLTRLVTGFAAAAVGTNASGVSQTFTTNRACTEVGIWYGKGPTLGNLKITVDGGSPTTIDTGNATQSWGNVWSSGTLSSAVHTIKVEGATGGSLNSGYSTAVEAYFFDSATTPKVLGSWRQGNKTSQFTQAVNPNWQEGYANNYPDVVVIHLGTNDAVAGVSAATYQTNLQEIVTTLNALATPPSAIVVGAMPKSNYLTGSTYTDYYNAVATVVANNANTLLWDINEDLGDNQATNYADVFTAGVHPNAYGHQVMANSIARIILPPYNEYQEIRQAAGDVGIAGQTDYNGTSGTGAGVVTTPNFFNSRKFGAAVPTYPGQILTAIDTFNVAQAGWQAPAPNRYTLTVSGSTYTIDTNKTGLAIISSPSADFTVTTSGNTPLDGQPLILRVKSGATPYVPTWNSIFTSSGLVTLPTTYPASKTVTHKFAYDAVATKWVLMALDPTGY
jgi:lysophospholipase L1-like esterase